jgi:hypothetical protein
MPGLSGRAGDSILQFLQVFFICSVALVPGQSHIALAVEILTIAGFCWITQVLAHVRYGKARSGQPLIWLMTRIIQTHIASIPFFTRAPIYSRAHRQDSIGWCRDSSSRLPLA